MAKHPTGPRQNARKKAKKRYQSAREEVQLLDLIPTTPDGAVKPERVDPSSQEQPGFPRLVGAAIRRGWAVPDQKKPGLVDELVGVVEDPDAKPFDKVAAFGALSKADQLQHERDQEYIKLDRVLAMWHGVLEAARRHMADVVALKAFTDDVLRLLPVPAGAEVIEGGSFKNGHGQ